MKFSLKLLIFVLVFSLGIVESRRPKFRKKEIDYVNVDGRPMTKKEIEILVADIDKLEEWINAELPDDQMVQNLRTLNYLQESFMYIDGWHISYLWRGTKNLEKVFGLLKPSVFADVYSRVSERYKNRIHKSSLLMQRLGYTRNEAGTKATNGKGDKPSNPTKTTSKPSETAKTSAEPLKPAQPVLPSTTASAADDSGTYNYFRKYGYYFYDQYNRAMTDKQVEQLEKDVLALAKCVVDPMSDDEIVGVVKSLTFREEAFTTIHNIYVVNLFNKLRNIDKVFTLLKPKTIYILWYYKLGNQVLGLRSGQYPGMVDIMARYLNGEIDGEGNSRSGNGKSTTEAPSTTTEAASYNYVNKYGRYFYNEYNYIMNDAQVAKLEKDIEVIAKCIREQWSDDKVIETIKSLTYREETFKELDYWYATNFFMQVQNIDNVFLLLKPKTLYHLYYYLISRDALNARNGQYPRLNYVLYQYVYGYIDGEGNSRSHTPAPDCGPGGCNPNANPCYPDRCRPNVPPATQPADSGPLNEHYRLLLFKTIPDLHPYLINALPELHWTFTEYVLSNAKIPAKIISYMHSNTLRWVVKSVPTFGDFLATTDKATIRSVFEKIPYPCDYYRSLEQTVRDQLSFKHNWLYRCEPTTTTTTTTTPETMTTTTTEKVTTLPPEPLMDLETLQFINKRYPNLGVLLEIVGLDKLNPNNQKARYFIMLLNGISDEDAVRANKLIDQVHKGMDIDEVAGIFYNGTPVFPGAMTIYKFIVS